MPKLLLIQGPNLSYLGRRQPELYGTTTAKQLDALLQRHARDHGYALEIFYTHDEAAAIAMANDSEYGLAAYFFTRDASRLMRVAEALAYGIVGANDALPSTAEAPFGGVKQSGFGREGGRWGLEEFTSVKYVSWRL